MSKEEIIKQLKEHQEDFNGKDKYSRGAWFAFNLAIMLLEKGDWLEQCEREDEVEQLKKEMRKILQENTVWVEKERWISVTGIIDLEKIDNFIEKNFIKQTYKQGYFTGREDLKIEIIADFDKK